MDSRRLLFIAAALLGVGLVWWMVSAGSGGAPLRIEAVGERATPPARADSPMEFRPFSRDTAAPNSTGYEQTLEELEKAKDRIAELERTVNELSDAWNQFAAAEEAKRKKASMRSWGPEQATGPADTQGAGDRPTAWAPLAQDGGMEWLQTEYEKPVEVAQIRVLQNDGAGAVVKVTAVTAAGGESVLWTGAATPSVTAPFDQYIPAPPGIVAQSIRVYLDTKQVPGWNEIDAVELIGRDGSRQWAASASASSTYAQGNARPAAAILYDQDYNAHLQTLEAAKHEQEFKTARKVSP